MVQATLSDLALDGVERHLAAIGQPDLADDLPRVLKAWRLFDGTHVTVGGIVLFGRGDHIIRNPHVYTPVADAGLVTRAGTGVRRMARLMREATGKDLGPSVTDYEVLVTLPRAVRSAAAFCWARGKRGRSRGAGRHVWLAPSARAAHR